MAINEATRSTVHVGGLIVGLGEETAADGTTALQIWTITGTPQSTLGANGDWALSTNGHIYNRASGTWSQIV